MIFQHTLENVLNGSKTQTRRVIKPQDNALTDAGGRIIAIVNNGRMKWAVGRTYAVQPSRTGRAVARIEITDLRREPADAISLEDARAEGYPNREAFLAGWAKIHGAHAAQQPVWVVQFRLVAA